jgi:UDP-hydrolysing UDP-N-acetyl-D-glucosamine 2-epimerase
MTLTETRSVGVITTGRADYGISRNVAHALADANSLRTHLYVVGGRHPTDGQSLDDQIKSDGFQDARFIRLRGSSDSPLGIGQSISETVSGFAEEFERDRPDFLVMIGDRFEILGAAAAALLQNIAMVHVHGGEVSRGAIDDVIRHALTKFSHLHFTATEAASRNVIGMGEEPWRVTVSGAPSLDSIKSHRPMSQKELEEICGISLNQPPMVVTFHPETLDFENAKTHAEILTDAVSQFERPIVVTAANQDTHGSQINRVFESLASEKANVTIVDSLGTQAYFSLLGYASVMIGNSSSGLLEAPSFGLPVVNIGTRQSGRARAENVIDAEIDRNLIFQAVQRALAPEFRESLVGMTNPYGDGEASRRIRVGIEQTPVDRKLLMKKLWLGQE